MRIDPESCGHREYIDARFDADNEMRKKKWKTKKRRKKMKTTTPQYIPRKALLGGGRDLPKLFLLVARGVKSDVKTSLFGA